MWWWGCGAVGLVLALVGRWSEVWSIGTFAHFINVEASGGVCLFLTS